MYKEKRYYTPKVIALSKIFQNGKCQVPKKIRDILGIKDGDTVVWIQDLEGRIIIEKSA